MDRIRTADPQGADQIVRILEQHPEGATLDTQNLIELGRHAPGKDQRETQMILNHKAVIEMLVDNVDQVRLSRSRDLGSDNIELI